MKKKCKKNKKMLKTKEENISVHCHNDIKTLCISI